MTRNHIHLAQGLIGHNIVSGKSFLPPSHQFLIPSLPGMRHSASVFIYIDLQKAINAGIEFGLSANGVVLSAGNEEGVIPPEFFQRVEQRAGADKRTLIPGWEGSLVPDSTVPPVDVEQLQKQLETTQATST